MIIATRITTAAAVLAGTFISTSAATHATALAAAAIETLSTAPVPAGY
jgi:hypothetical protein